MREEYNVEKVNEIEVASRKPIHYVMRALGAISILIAFVGLFVIYGTVGALECDSISNADFSRQILLGFIMFVGGAVGGGLFRN